ncbi:MAG TPA: VOC family protein [Streptosporangiaceae bacterium]|nr:VOC family protein [Streptosporangiaceae bacterium]
MTKSRTTVSSWCRPFSQAELAGERVISRCINPVALDVKPVRRDQAAELGRLLALGARQVDVGQGARNWFVLADPRATSFDCAVPDAVRLERA